MVHAMPEDDTRIARGVTTSFVRNVARHDAKKRTRQAAIRRERERKTGVAADRIYIAYIGRLPAILITNSFAAPSADYLSAIGRSRDRPRFLCRHVLRPDVVRLTLLNILDERLPHDRNRCRSRRPAGDKLQHGRVRELQIDWSFGDKTAGRNISRSRGYKGRQRERRGKAGEARRNQDGEEKAEEALARYLALHDGS